MTPNDLLDLSPVIPVVVLRDSADAVPVARALVAGGLRAIEVTLRTPAALESIKRIAAEVPDAVVGAGTIVLPEQAVDAADAGARFLVSPGCTDRLRGAMADSGLPFLPGVSSASEAMALLENGLTAMKFFPAKAAGGPAYIKALEGPLPQVRFCPTGGIAPETARDYLSLPNVGCIGGTWLTPDELVRGREWRHIETLAHTAAGLRDG